MNKFFMFFLFLTSGCFISLRGIEAASLEAPSTGPYITGVMRFAAGFMSSCMICRDNDLLNRIKSLNGELTSVVASFRYLKSLRPTHTRLMKRQSCARRVGDLADAIMAHCSELEHLRATRLAILRTFAE